jgi:hypothetical protein
MGPRQPRCGSLLSGGPAEANVAPREINITEDKHVNVPVWAGVAPGDRGRRTSGQREELAFRRCPLQGRGATC